MHKGFKYLDIPTDRIYISRDVICDEFVIYFASLHSNAGTRYTTDVLLPSSNSGDNGTTNMTNISIVSVLPVHEPSVQLQHGFPREVTIADSVPAALFHQAASDSSTPTI
jgi:hypothetical protein